MVKVETLIKSGDKFISVDIFDGYILEPDYVEGAIILQINNKEILTKELWDDVNHLWGYIVYGFEDLLKYSKWKTGFPDQPIDLALYIDEKRNYCEIELYIPQCDFTETKKEVRKASAPLNEFLTAMSEAGQKFFLRMAEIVPEKRAVYEREAQRICEAADKLKNNFSKI